jgi:hypothetical protein
MKLNYFIFLIFFGMLFAYGCKEPEARKPVYKSSGSFMKESIVRNKKLIVAEEKAIDSIIKSNPEKNILLLKKDIGIRMKYKTNKILCDLNVGMLLFLIMKFLI